LEFRWRTHTAGLGKLENLNTYTNTAEAQNIKDTMEAARAMTPLKGSIWEPEDDEWMDVDAYVPPTYHILFA
jgi:hypothetical protein